MKNYIFAGVATFSVLIGYNIWLAQRDAQMWDKMDRQMKEICNNPKQTAPACASYQTVHLSPQTTL